MLQNSSDESYSKNYIFDNIFPDQFNAISKMNLHSEQNDSMFLDFYRKWQFIFS